MNDYKRGMELGEENLKSRINDAVETLDLSGFTSILANEKGKEAAIYLKETIDRVILIDYSLIPTAEEEITNGRWRLKNTSITIVKMKEGDSAGDYLFSKKTVENARSMFLKVKDLPYLKNSGQGAGWREDWSRKNLPTWMQKKFFGFDAWQWLGLLLALLFGFTGKFFAERILSVLRKFVEKTKGEWDDKLLTALGPPTGLICATIIWFLSLKVLRFDGLLLDFLVLVVQAVFSIGVVWLSYRLAGAATEIIRYVSKNKTFLKDSHLESLFLTGIKAFIIVFGILVSLQNLGINVVSLLAGLGIGGLALALAAKDTAANIFGSIMILWDRPFMIGDWIVVSGAEGTVEEIGFRSTRIRTFYNSQISIPNSQIANLNIDNMGRRALRRIKVNFGIAYDTPVEKIESFVEGIKNIILANKATDKSNFHVVFNNYGDSSLLVLLYCFLRVPDWAHELVERQNIFIEIKRLAEDLEVEFAFPTQTLHLASTPEKPLAEHTAPDTETLKGKSAAYGPEGDRSKPEGLGIFVPTYKS